MIRRLDRIAIIVISLFVGLQAMIPGWQIATDGSVYGFKLPPSWLTEYWPFGGYFVAGVLLLVVVGLGSLATAAINVLSERAGAVAAFVMGFVLIGWIGGELVFMSQTMIMTWMILGSGVVLVLLAAPFALPELWRLVVRTPRPRVA